MVEEICPECKRRVHVPKAEWEDFCSFFHVECAEETGSGDAGEYINSFGIFNGDLVATDTLIRTNEMSFTGIEPVD